MLVARTCAAKGPCLNTTSKTQTIEVDDTIAPSLTAPANKTGATHVEGCDTSAITGLTYSESAVTITAAQLSTAGGSASDACGLSCITYKDSKRSEERSVGKGSFTA